MSVDLDWDGWYTIVALRWALADLKQVIATHENLMGGLVNDGVLEEGDVVAGRKLVADLRVAFDVRSQWEPHRVGEWRRLVTAGLKPATARDVVLAMHFLC